MYRPGRRGRRRIAALLLSAVAGVGCGSLAEDVYFDGYVPAVDRNVTVTEVLLYESASGGTAAPEYTRTFDGSETRFIYWELRMEHEPAERDATFDLNGKIYDEVGNPMGYVGFPATLEKGTTRSVFGGGYGNDALMFWPHHLGPHSLELTADETFLARAEFEVR